MKNAKKKLERVTPKAPKAEAKKSPPLGIPLVQELQTRQPVIVAAGKTWVVKTF